MDGVHDLGGVEGFGPLPIEIDEPAFHHEWEGRVMGMYLLMSFWGTWNTDYGRHVIERLPPSDYLSMTYYEKWLAALVNKSVETGLITLDEVATGSPASGAEPAVGAPGEGVFRAVFPKGSPTERPVDAPPQFAVGDRVRTDAHGHSGHTRLPGYARGKVGEVVLLHGAHVFPDSNAAMAGEDPHHLYTVKFAARELWGPSADAGHSVTVDVWEPHLVPAT